MSLSNATTPRLFRSLRHTPRCAHTPLALRPRARTLHLAPPFLLDSYTPRYQLLSSVDAAKKRSLAHSHLSACNLCPRLCNVNRHTTTGHCLIGASARINVIGPHFGEEPCLQGQNGSGSVFFAGCNLRCVFCQNWEISHTGGRGDGKGNGGGYDLSPEELAAWMVKLQEVGGCANVNFVTPEHVVPQVALAVLGAREMGLNIPIVYNTSAFDSVESLELMDGLVDIYLPDFKVWNDETGKRLLKADNYVEHAKRSIKMMYDQVGDLCFTADGVAKKGVLVRHLVMPGKEEEGVEIVKWLAETLGRDCFVNIMEQYRPDAHVGKKGRGKGKDEVRYEDINRAVSEEEMGFVKRAAREAGLWRFNEVARHGGFNI